MATKTDELTNLLARARAEGSPVVTGDTATFVWQGDRPPDLIGDMTGWTPLETGPGRLRFEPSGRKLWTLTLRPEPDAYLEYALIVDGQRRLDPLNPRRTPNGFGDTNNYFHMPEAPRSPLFRRRRGVARGQISRHVLGTRYLAAGRRRVWLYRPAATGPMPLLLVLDGADYVGRVQLPALLDNLIAVGQLPPLTAVFLDNAGPSRFVEYACSEGLVNFVLHDLLPWLGPQTSLRSEPGSHGVLGASMGGLAALWLGIRLPQIFGQVFSQAGAFSIGATGELGLTELIRIGPRRPIRIYLDTGTYDFLYQGIQAMRRLLHDRGYPVTYQEFHAGHNYPAWREDLAPGLRWLFPPAEGRSATPGRTEDAGDAG